MDSGGRIYDGYGRQKRHRWHDSARTSIISRTGYGVSAARDTCTILFVSLYIQGDNVLDLCKPCLLEMITKLKLAELKMAEK
jgi:hypothetical protein